MFTPMKVIDIDFGKGPLHPDRLDGYDTAYALLRVFGTPIGIEKLPLTNGHYDPQKLRKAILEKHAHRIIRTLVAERLKKPLDHLLTPEALFSPQEPNDSPAVSMKVTIAVCTRDRAADLDLCLGSLCRLDYPDLEVIVVDNAPATEATARLVAGRYPSVRYVREPRPGLDWARNRAIIEAQGEIIAFTDDDVVVDPHWVSALINVFAENPAAMAVTGLVLPYELETEAQWLFELYGGFNRGFDPKWVHLGKGSLKSAVKLHGGTGKFGTGANMAFRRELFERIGYFDPALDVGTATNGGGDLEMFFRVIREGYGLVYDPGAIVWHRHRREYGRLLAQLESWGTGFAAYLARCAIAYPREVGSWAKLGIWWLWWLLRRFAVVSAKPTLIPKELILQEIRGLFTGFTRYARARRKASGILRRFGTQHQGSLPKNEPSRNPQATGPKIPSTYSSPAAVRSIDLAELLQPLKGLDSYNRVRLHVTWQGRPIGNVTIRDISGTIGTDRLRREIANSMALDMFSSDQLIDKGVLWSEIVNTFFRHCLSDATMATVEKACRTRLPSDIPVSVVVSTLDRPLDLRRCLTYLSRQQTHRKVEIIVVDNNPASGMTPPVVAEFPMVVLTSETRRGLSYARNRGICASHGKIIAVTDDDAIMPEDWIENIVAPFVQKNVMIVTGNVLPAELETPAQVYFELYGGLGRGFMRMEADRDWFDGFSWKAVQTWRLGATACAAFRSDIFGHPAIGLLNEALGPGTPTGVGEDTYLFYKVLKEGYRIVYEPAAYVWHRHRRSMKALRRQIYNYSKGHVAYHLTTLFQDGDLRALSRLFYELPRYHASRIKDYLRGRLDYPVSLAFLELVGNMAGPWALWRSRKRVKRLGSTYPDTRPASHPTE
ncbi:glycosyltransferase family 2 protein [Desulfatirhabdium butyrativorans]|uniref:glycosyltransferase family 2 protein n=1 Tax=Desulfatirhabdium butyrativorans TaxID=340467 RepID=UPI0003FB2FFD|nr:glycosyltransferase [Desulfatirhabdium butyrativorans]